MDLLLRFKNQNHARKYKEKNFKSHLVVGYQTFLIYTIFHWVFYTILQNFLQHEVFMEQWPYQPIFVVIAVIFCLFTWLLSRKLGRKEQNRLKTHIKALITCYDLIFVLGLSAITVLLLGNWKVQNNKMGNSVILQNQGISTILNLLLISTLAFRWFTKSIILSGIFLFQAIYQNDLDTNPGRLSLINGIINSLMIIIFIYKYEKAGKTMFLEKEKSLDLSKTWNKIFNTVSEGLLVLNTEGTSRFYNKSLEDMAFGNRNYDDEESSPTLEPKKKKINLDNLAIFENVTVSQYDEKMRQSFLSFCQFSRKEEEGDIGSVIMAGGEEKPSSHQIELVENHRCENLATFLNHVINKFVLKMASQDSEEDLKNKKYSVLLEAFCAPNTEMERSFQIKLWFIYLENQPSLVLIFSETSQLKLLHRLQDRDNYKSRLLASVSHELRTPLNGSINLIEHCVDSPLVPEPIKEKYLVPAFRSNMFLLHIINDILDLSQIQANKLRLSFENKDISEAVTESVKLVELQAKKKSVEILTDYRFEGEYFMTTDHNRLKQVILNLLSNAVKFTQRGIIRLIIDDAPKSVDHQRCLKVEVRDTGIGMSEQDRGKLFKEFTKIDSQAHSKLNPSGVGLGLMISDSLAKRLGPKNQEFGLQVSSIVGKGSMFWFILEDKSPINYPKTSIGMKKISTSKSLHEPASAGISPRKRRNPDVKLSCVRFTENSFESPTNKFFGRRVSLAPQYDHDGGERSSDTEVPHELEFCELESPSPISKNRFNFDIQSTARIMLPSMLPHQSLMRGISGNVEMPESSKLSSKCLCAEVLIIDDDSFNILALETILTSVGISFNYGFNGQEALSMASKRANDRCGEYCQFYKIILMDCNMPIMDGFQASKRLKEMMSNREIPSAPIIACTALVESKEVTSLIYSGMDSYCVKPVTKAKIEDILLKFF